MLDDLCFRITDKAKERGHHMELICKKCLLREMAEADAEEEPAKDFASSDGELVYSTSTEDDGDIDA